jgi:hypothetical protein
MRALHAALQLSVDTALRIRAAASFSDVPKTAGRMLTDVRYLFRIAYVRLFVYTVVASFVLLYAAVFVYDFVLPTVLGSLGLYDLDEQLSNAAIQGTDLVLFAIIASVPIINCARLLFLARISGTDAARTFTLRSLFRSEGIELALLILIVPFLSRELFEATGLPSMLNTLSPLSDALVGEGSIVEIRQWATTMSVLYLYPSIILVYLSHSRLSNLYPFTQFLTIARSWDYFLLVVTILPVAVLYVLAMDEASWSSSSNIQLMAIFVVLTALVFQFVFVRLGAIVVADEELKRTFSGEVHRETQRTLNEFS